LMQQPSTIIMFGVMGLGVLPGPLRLHNVQALPAVQPDPRLRMAPSRQALLLAHGRAANGSGPLPFSSPPAPAPAGAAAERREEGAAAAAFPARHPPTARHPLQPHRPLRQPAVHGARGARSSRAATCEHWPVQRRRQAPAVVVWSVRSLQYGRAWCCAVHRPGGDWRLPSPGRKPGGGAHLGLLCSTPKSHAWHLASLATWVLWQPHRPEQQQPLRQAALPRCWSQPPL
jgi:hypothetical protein